MRTLWAFIRRDLRVELSYPTSWGLGAAGGLVTLAALFFLARTVGTQAWAARGGTDYFSFAVVGVAVSAILRSVQSSFGHRLREAQLDGSLELLLASPRPTLLVMSGLGAYPVVSGVVRAALLAFAGWLFFGARLSPNPASLLLVLALSALAFGALGMLSAAFVLVFKRSDPFSYLLDSASYLFCGVIYPLDVLPPALRWVSKVLPATYAIEGLRASGLADGSLSTVLPDVLALAAFCAALWPLAALALAWARKYAERAGLSQA